MKEVKRDDWFSDLEAEYLESLKEELRAFKEAKASFDEAADAVEEAVGQLMRIHEKYPPDYDGPAPLF